MLAQSWVHTMIMACFNILVTKLAVSYDFREKIKLSLFVRLKKAGIMAG